MISIRTIGDWAKTKLYLHKLSEGTYLEILNSCGEKGVAALQQSTPKDSGVTSESWDYIITKSLGRTTIEWTNSNLGPGGFPIAIKLQYGHGTGTGGYVQGVDYINPAIQPIFDQIAETVWEAIQKL